MAAISTGRCALTISCTVDTLCIQVRLSEAITSSLTQIGTAIESRSSFDSRRALSTIDKCTVNVRNQLEAQGYEVMVFHTLGSGGMAEAGELQALARHMGGLITDAARTRGPVSFFVPTTGFSHHDSPEGHLHDAIVEQVLACTRDRHQAVA